MKSTQTQMTYALEESPPLAILIVLAVQHVLVAIVDLTLPVLVVRSMGGTPAQTAWMVQMSLVAIAVGTLLQIQNKGIGSGFLIPHSTTAIYLAPSLLAAGNGGVALLAGMTVIAGVAQIFFAGLSKRLHKLFPVHLSGLVLAICGCVLVHAAIPRLLGCNDVEASMDWRTVVVGSTTLAAMTGLLLKGRGRLRLCGLAIGLAIGCLLSAVLNLEDNQMAALVRAVPLMALPDWQHPGFDVDPALLGPFLIAALVVGMKGSGLIAKGHQINRVASDGYGRRLGAGLLADGAGTLLSGMLGGYGSAMSAANVGLSVASRATSRRIGYGVAAIFLLLIFFPKFTTALSSLPRPVMGAIMVCIGFHLVGIGIQLMRMTPPSRSFFLTLGVPFLVGIWVAIVPSPFPEAPPLLRSLLADAISATAILAFGLHHLSAGFKTAGAALKGCRTKPYVPIQKGGQAWTSNR